MSSLSPVDVDRIEYQHTNTVDRVGKRLGIMDVERVWQAFLRGNASVPGVIVEQIMGRKSR